MYENLELHSMQMPDTQLIKKTASLSSSSLYWNSYLPLSVVKKIKRSLFPFFLNLVSIFLSTSIFQNAKSAQRKSSLVTS